MSGTHTLSSTTCYSGWSLFPLSLLLVTTSLLFLVINTVDTSAYRDMLCPDVVNYVIPCVYNNAMLNFFTFQWVFERLVRWSIVHSVLSSPDEQVGFRNLAQGRLQVDCRHVNGDVTQTPSAGGQHPPLQSTSPCAVLRVVYSTFTTFTNTG